MQAVCILWRWFLFAPSFRCRSSTAYVLVGNALLQIGRSFIGNNLNSRHFVDTKFIKLMASNQFNGVSNGVSFHFVNNAVRFVHIMRGWVKCQQRFQKSNIKMRGRHKSMNRFNEANLPASFATRSTQQNEFDWIWRQRLAHNVISAEKSRVILVFLEWQHPDADFILASNSDKYSIRCNVPRLLFCSKRVREIKMWIFNKRFEWIRATLQFDYCKIKIKYFIS